MPGIFGAIGCPDDCHERLVEEFAAAWSESVTHSLGEGLIGGHAHAPAEATHRLPDDTVFAVDGEAGLYQAAAAFVRSSGPPLWHAIQGVVRVDTVCEGNLAIADAESGHWWVAAGLVGLFPIYYSTAAGGLMFSTLLRPLARAVESVIPVKRDLLALVERMRDGYMLAGRTCFRDIHRLLPGQTLEYDNARGRLVVHESHSLWENDDAPSPSAREEFADQYWQGLRSATGRAAALGEVALMMSGGWDSRTLLAALRHDSPHGLSCYTHGDLESREVAITRRLCRVSDVPFVAEPLTADVYEPSFLDSLFAKVETAAFPHWLQAGTTLAKPAAATVVSGMYGEVVGGQYSSVMPNRGMRKALALATLLASNKPVERKGSEVDLAAVRDLLSPPTTTKPWYLTQDIWDAVTYADETAPADAEWALDRLTHRGARTREQLIEAFIIEHRAAQNPGEQVLSCRASIDVSLPFADRHLLVLATKIPMELKVQNSLNRMMLMPHARDLLHVPTAATLVPASAPILVQEASRLLRRTCDGNRWRLHSLTKGMLPFPRSSWWQLEFLRDGVTFRNLLDDLQSDLWDRGAIRTRILDNAQDRIRLDSRSTTALLSQHMLRIATIDRMLR